MMPGIGFGEMVLLAIVAIVVVGPRDLPLMMRKFGRFTGKMRAMAFEFRQGFEELGRQAELEELRREVADLKKHTGLQELEDDLKADRANLEKDVNSALQPAEPPKTAIGTAAATDSVPDPASTPVAPAASPDDSAGPAGDSAGSGAHEDGNDSVRMDDHRQAATAKQDVPA